MTRRRCEVKLVLVLRLANAYGDRAIHSHRVTHVRNSADFVPCIQTVRFATAGAYEITLMPPRGTVQLDDGVIAREWGGRA